MPEDVSPQLDDFTDVTLKQRKFIDEYLVTGNKYQSALKAGYSPRSLYTLAYKEFGNVRVQAYYKHRMAEISARSENNISKLLNRLEEIAFDDVTNYVDKDGNVKGFDKLAHGRNVHSIRHTKTGVDITLCSREKALELLCKYHGMLTDKLELSGVKDAALNITFEGVLPGDPRIENTGKS